MKKVLVKSVNQNYPVLIGGNNFRMLPQLILKLDFSERIFVIVDKNVNLLFGRKINRVLKSAADKKHCMIVAASEKNKSLKSAEKIFSSLYKKKFGRDTLVIAIGGGTISDLAGFVASNYMRGVSLIHIPTTLLSAVDSSVGGKTGVNYKETKNLIGTFYQPSFVLTDTDFLKSLPEKELISGFGEVIKYSYLIDADFYFKLLSNYSSLNKKDSNFFVEMVHQCVKIKSAVVSADEFEKSGLRKILNFGHTFAHAYESISNFRISHGKAVIIGIINALHLSFELGLINKQQLKEMVELPLRYKAKIGLENFSENDIFKLMTYDKKNRAGEIKFVLLRNFGEIIVDVSADRKSVLKAIKETKKVLV